MQSLSKLLVLLKIHVEGFDKILRLFIFVIFANIFKIVFSFDSVFTHKVPKNCHSSFRWAWHCLNLIVSFRVYINKYRQICFFYLKYCKLGGMFCFLKLCNFLNLLIWILNCSKCAETENFCSYFPPLLLLKFCIFIENWNVNKNGLYNCYNRITVKTIRWKK